MSAIEMEGKNHLVLVVGYDGTEPSQRALRTAADTLGRSPGRMEVVFVAHMAAAAGLSGLAIPAYNEGFEHDVVTFESRVEEALAGTDIKWHFQRRDGDIASELLAAADEQLLAEGPDTRVVLVLGGSAHRIDRYLNSTPTRVIRHDRFEVHVVP